MKAVLERYVVDEKGQKKEVIISFQKYEELLENIHDLAIVAERRNEATVSLNELKKRLKSDGLI